MKKYVYLFSEGNKDMKDILGGKGANIAEMVNMGINVPKGFTVSTDACNDYYKNNEELSEDIRLQVELKLKEVELESKKEFGNPHNPLLLSVRSGARASMPGMMDTILNLGLNDEIAANMAKNTNNSRFVYDSYRRLIMMYADVVKGLDKDIFERFLTIYKEQKKYTSDLDLTSDDLIEITHHFKTIYKDNLHEEFPSDVYIQLVEAISAVFRSWNNERAIYYRKMNDIPDSWGTAVNVQEMVYGNLSKNSGTGVAFSRNPSTGEDEFYGEYLINAQGEDVVAGVRTPEPISKLKSDMPDVYNEFISIAKLLEKHYKDMQDMEFTIENGKLFMLQTRIGKRTAPASIKIAMDMYHEGLITKEEAILQVDPDKIDELLHKVFNEQELKIKRVIATGLAASPGAACGKICFEANKAIEMAKNGEKVVLVRLETSPEDIEGVNYSEGILTIRGGMTSHAAVVARGMGKCCVSGASELSIVNNTLQDKNGNVLNEGDYISIDGSTGNVYFEQISLEEPENSDLFNEFMTLVDSVSKMEVRVNADTVDEAKKAKEFGAKGIGLCRTEHMFFSEERIFDLRKMILAKTTEEREKALDKLIKYQMEDIEGLLKVMAPLPVVIRYLDPPLHEFLPKTEKEINDLAKSLNLTKEEINIRINELKEFNPMMGHRGCRLAVTYPEIAVMQTKAVIQAAINAINDGYLVKPEIMIPLIVDLKELKFVKNIIVETANRLIKEAGVDLEYKVGTMIETPRACIISDELAKNTSFFSFGTNDLTQLTYGFSRDDASKFLNSYYDKGLFNHDVFATIDEEGVGKLMQSAIASAKKVNNNIELGICGEHAGEKKSIDFCYRIGLDYVSCSTYRIYNARVAVAHASINNKKLS
ncbi:MAG: pyruvate, phosphate dikinase [Bacilli bacterium]|nr:pyruvate, phosphate dikinase [Bacilli bacterium]